VSKRAAICGRGVPEEISCAAGCSFSKASFSRRSAFQSSATRSRSSSKGGTPAGSSSAGFTIAGPRAVGAEVFDIFPSLRVNASCVNCALAPTPGIGSPRATHGVVLNVTTSLCSLRSSSSESLESLRAFSTSSRASRLVSASALRWRSAASASVMSPLMRPLVKIGTLTPA
jgi:hypothetical protein